MSALTDGFFQSAQFFDNRRRNQAQSKLQAALEGLPYDSTPTIGAGGYADGLQQNADWRKNDIELNNRLRPGVLGPDPSAPAQSPVQSALQGVPSQGAGSKLAAALGTTPAGSGLGAALSGLAKGDQGVGAPDLPPHVQARMKAMEDQAAAQGKVPTYQEMMAATGAGVNPNAQAPVPNPEGEGLLAKELAATKAVGHSDTPNLAQAQANIQSQAAPAPLMADPKDKDRAHEVAMASAEAAMNQQSTAQAGKFGIGGDAPTQDSKQEAMGPPARGKDGKLYQPTLDRDVFQGAAVTAPGAETQKEAEAPLPDFPAPGHLPGDPPPAAARPPVQTPPPAAAPLSNINPSPYALRKLTEANVSVPHNAMNKVVPFSSLPPEWQKTLGVEGATGGAPLSLIQDVIGKKLEGQNFQARQSLQSPSDAAIALGDAVKSGAITVPGAAAQLSRMGGVRPADLHFLENIGNAAATQGRADATLNESKERLEQTKNQNQIMNEDRAVKLKDAQDKRLDDQVTKYGSGIEKSGYPESRQDLDQLRGLTNNLTDTEKLPGVWTNAANNKLPFIGHDVANVMARGFGGSEALKVLTDIDNIRAHGLFGARLTDAEIGRLNQASGNLASSDENDRIQGLKIYENLLEEKKATYDAGYSEKVRSEYGNRKGLIDQARGKGQEGDALSSQKNDSAAAPSNGGGEYETRLSQAQNRIAALRDDIQKQIASGKISAHQASRMVNAEKDRLGQKLQSAFGKGFVDAQTP